MHQQGYDIDQLSLTRLVITNPLTWYLIPMISTFLWCLCCQFFDVIINDYFSVAFYTLFFIARWRYFANLIPTHNPWSDSHQIPPKTLPDSENLTTSGRVWNYEIMMGIQNQNWLQRNRLHSLLVGRFSLQGMADYNSGEICLSRDSLELPNPEKLYNRWRQFDPIDSKSPKFCQEREP